MLYLSYAYCYSIQDFHSVKTMTRKNTDIDTERHGRNAEAYAVKQITTAFFRVIVYDFDHWILSREAGFSKI